VETTDKTFRRTVRRANWSEERARGVASVKTSVRETVHQPDLRAREEKGGGVRGRGARLWASREVGASVLAGSGGGYGGCGVN